MGSKRRQVIDVTAVAERLHSAAIHLLRRVRTEDVASGLSPARLSALSVIVFAGPITVSDLAQAEQIRPPTASRLAKELEGQGLLRRTPDANDGRVQWLRATKAGRRLLESGRARRVAKLAEALGQLPAAERRLLAQAAGVLDRVSRGEP